MKMRSEYIAKFFGEGEVNIPCPCCNRNAVHPYILSIADYIRFKQNAPMIITSGTRCQKHLQNLKTQGYQVADHSPHLIQWDGYSYALDIAIPRKFKSSKEYRDYIRDELFIKDIRIGWQKYLGQGFIHIDCAFLLIEDDKHKKANAQSLYWYPSVEW